MSSSQEEGSVAGGRESANSKDGPKSTAKQVFDDYDNSEASELRKVSVHTARQLTGQFKLLAGAHF